MDYIELARTAVKEAERLGAYTAEAYILDARSLLVEVLNQEVETLKQANDTGVGIRVIAADGRMGFAYSTSVDNASLREVAGQAIANSHNSVADKFNVLPPPLPALPLPKLVDPAIARTPVETKIGLAKAVETAARAADSRVRRTERCAYEDAEYGVALANSHGLVAHYRSGYCGLFGVMLAEEDGDVQSGMGLTYTRDFAGLDPQAVGREAADDACRVLGAKRIETTRAALVLSPYIASSFLGVLLPALSADAVLKGRSLFKDKLGAKVASPLFTLVDDGRLEGGIAAAPVDGEGVPTKRNELIAGGVLGGYLHNTYTAGRAGTVSTGNGVRHSFKGLPEAGSTNVFVAAGATDSQKLIAGVKNGFYVTSVMGMHTANPISGDFSVGAAGIWIENGEFTRPVRGVAIAGNILELLAGVDAVGDDLRFFGPHGAPTLRIGQITVSGA
jgi:PmbA protein